MFQLGLYLTLIAVLVSLAMARNFPSDIPQCKYDDNECIKGAIKTIVRDHPTGHAGLNIVSLEPLRIKSLLLPKNPNSPVNIEFKFTDVDMHGSSHLEINKFSGFTKDASNLNLEMDVRFPKIVVTGPYSVDGRVLILPITGKGNAKVGFENLNTHIKLKCKAIEKKGKKHIEVVNVDMSLNPSKVVFQLDNLFNGDKTLGENMNKFLNENSPDIYKELRPSVEEAIGKIIKNVANPVFSKFSYSELFLE